MMGYFEITDQFPPLSVFVFSVIRMNDASKRVTPTANREAPGSNPGPVSIPRGISG